MRQYDRPIGGELPGGIDPNRGKLETNRGELTGDRGESDAIPTELLELIQALGRKPPQARLRHVLLRLAEFRLETISPNGSVSIAEHLAPTG